MSTVKGIIRWVLVNCGLWSSAVYFKINYKNPRKVVNRAIEELADFLDRLRMLFVRLESVKGELETSSIPGQPRITITMCSRKSGNPDNALQNFLDSFVKCTANIGNVEVLLKVDDDDNLLHFLRVKRNYDKKVNLRIFSTPRLRGYGDMHHFHSFLISQRSPKSLVHFILTDDAELQHLGWDDDLLERSSKVVGSCFIGTTRSIEETIMMHGPSPVEPIPIYWIGGDDYPIFSFRLLGIAKNVTSKYDGWTEFGNYFCIDQFAGVLIKAADSELRKRIHLRVPQYARRGGGEVNWSENPKRAQTRNHALGNYFKTENQTVWKEILLSLH